MVDGGEELVRQEKVQDDPLAELLLGLKWNRNGGDAKMALCQGLSPGRDHGADFQGVSHGHRSFQGCQHQGVSTYQLQQLQEIEEEEQRVNQ